MVFEREKVKNLFRSLKDLVAIGSANGIAALISGLFWFLMANLLGTDQYGKTSYLITIATMTGAIASFGAVNTIMTFTAKEQKTQTPVYFLVIILSITASLIILFVFENIELSLIVVGSSTFSLITTEYLGRKRFTDYSKYVISQKILLVALGSSLYILMGPKGIIVGFAISYIPYFIKLYTNLKGSKFELNSIKLRLGFMANSFTMDLTNVLVISADKLIVYPMFGYSLLGNYQLGMQFLSLLTILPGSVYQYILPRQASGIFDKRLVRGTVFLSVIIVSLGVFLTPLVIPHIFPQFKESTEIIQIMILAVVPATLNYVYVSKFFAMDKSRIVLLGSLIYLGVQTVAIVILGKIFGINGASAAPVLGASMMTIYFIIIARTMK